MTDRIGLVGLGQMGLPIAGRISGAFDLVAYDLSAQRRALAADLPRTTVTEDLADVADARRIVLSLPTPAISRQVLGDLVPRLAAGTVVVETSTVLPDDVRDARRILEPAGVGIVDAAVLSGVAQMAQGAATLLVGGEDEDVSRTEDLLAVIGGGGVLRLGALGSGMAAKVVNNGVAHAVMVVLVEAFAMARAEGVALEDVAAMLRREDGGLQRPLNHRIMQRVAGGDFEGGMPLDAARKDSTLALAMAQRSGIPLFATQAAQTVYDLAVSAGLGREDYSAIAQLWEEWSGRDLRFGDGGR
ncbi:NAD(P)-dependent oxidoreductase [Microbacterium resistens]|uniref:NAD(P)-dependent oxidoreductase n=1 Tax=Microbacterium resistens TaxID=156977 RepID=A0ABY3RW05_9MICO|nr:NAD(P)-dependent oxidoreductase [Microbacterium resistens]UGS27049.1 NAD(P)-dependent oxidoreductase [Microbacterium resistens]